jgi:hypothetical protein
MRCGDRVEVKKETALAKAIGGRSLDSDRRTKCGAKLGEFAENRFYEGAVDTETATLDEWRLLDEARKRT